MNTNIKFSKLGRNVSLAASLLLLAPIPLAAQIPTTGQSAPLTVVAPQQNQPPTTTPDSPPPVYGLQGVLIETLDGKIVSAQAADQTFNPASSVKLATALVALKNFGPDHRFTTGFWTDGSLDKTTGQITGNLYVTGRDPSFHYEHAV